MKGLLVLSRLWVVFLIILSAVCLASPSQAESFAIPRSTIVDVKSEDGRQHYQLFIKLPRSWKKSPKRRYPVVYMTDGLYSFQTLSGATRFPMNSGAMEEAILVGLSYNQQQRGMNSRILDYTPSSNPEWKRATGGAAVFAAFIEKHVFPLIEKEYRGASQGRIYVGHSLGGLFGAWLLLQKPALFDRYN